MPKNQRGRNEKRGHNRTKQVREACFEGEGHEEDQNEYFEKKNKGK